MSNNILKLLKKRSSAREYINKPIPESCINKIVEGVVKVSDFEVDSSITILNPDQHICTISKGGSLKAECVVKWGRGYVIAENNKSSSDPIGSIAIDSMFSPVCKANYTVTSARVGERTDYDKLIFELWTDGSISPDTALALG